MILGHTIEELRKSVVQLIFAAAGVVAFFVTFDPNLPQAVAAVALAAFGVIAVFNAPRRSYSDVSKALMSLVTAGLALYGFFHTFHAGESERVIAITGALLNVGAVFFVRNANAITPPTVR